MMKWLKRLFQGDEEKIVEAALYIRTRDHLQVALNGSLGQAVANGPVYLHTLSEDVRNVMLLAGVRHCEQVLKGMSERNG